MNIRARVPEKEWPLFPPELSKILKKVAHNQGFLNTIPQAGFYFENKDLNIFSV